MIEKKIEPSNTIIIAACCKEIILARVFGRNGEEELIGVDVSYNAKKDEYYVICPKCGCSQVIDRYDIKELF